MAEPMLIITPNAEALDILKILVERPADGEELAWTATIPLTITREDLQRYMYGQGDLVQIGFWPQADGTVEAVAFPDPEMPASPFGS